MKTIVLISIAVVLVSCASTPVDDGLRLEIDRKDRELVRLGDEVDRLKNELETWKSRPVPQDLSSDLYAAHATALALQQRIDQLERELAQARVKAQNEESKARELKESLNDLSQSLQAKKSELESKLAELAQEKYALQQALDHALLNQRTLEEALAAETTKLAQAAEKLKKVLKVEIDRGELEIVQYNNVLVVNIKDSVLFEPESAQLKTQFHGVLKNVAAAFDQFPDKVVRVEGHTAVSRNSRWNSWDLGSARAVSVVRFFQEKAGVDPLKLLAVSFGEYRPLASNQSEATRQKNRRVELVLIDRPVYQVKEILTSQSPR